MAYCGCAFRIHTVRIWRNRHVPEADPERHDVISNTFHHDNSRVSGLKVFILLTDGVNRDTGSFRFHNAKVSRRIVRSFGYFHRFMQTKGILKRLTNQKHCSFLKEMQGTVRLLIRRSVCMVPVFLSKDLTETYFSLKFTLTRVRLRIPLLFFQQCHRTRKLLSIRNSVVWLGYIAQLHWLQLKRSWTGFQTVNES